MRKGEKTIYSEKLRLPYRPSTAATSPAAKLYRA